MKNRKQTILQGLDLGHLGLDEGDIQRAFGLRYEVLEFIGSGASAAVFRVADLVAGAEIKAARLSSLACPDGITDRLDALRAEFRLASHFAHPNLVRYLDLDVDPGGRFLLTTMEFVEGMPFGPELTRRDVAVTCELAVELLRGLQFLHECGFVHGDVKPSNVLCQVYEGGLGGKLLDYHLTFRPAADVANLSRGTLRYMAPEVIAGESADGRSDLYSVGVLLYEALTDGPLFAGSPQDIWAQHLTAPAAKLEDSGELAEVLARLLSKRPEGRHQSAAEVIVALADATGKQWTPETRDTLLGRVRSTPLVGRDDALAEFTEFIDSPHETPGSARAFMIHGRPGAGRTRILRGCETEAQVSGCTTLRLQPETETGSILGKIEKWLGIETPAEGPDIWHAKDGKASYGSFASSTVTSRTHERGGRFLAPPLVSRLDRVIQHISCSGTTQKLALFFDDVDSWEHEAQESLFFLVRGASRTPMRFCLSLPDTAHCQESLKRQVQALEEGGLARTVIVEDLDSEARSCLLSRMLPAATPSKVIQALTQAMGGSPAVITATVAHLVSTGGIAVDARGEVLTVEHFADSVPDSIAALGSRLLQSDDPDVRHVLELLAVAEEEVDDATLASAVRASPETLRNKLESGSAAAAISFRATRDGTLYGFRHRSTGSVILKLLPPGRLAELHDGLADVIASSPDAQPSRMAAHAAMHRLQGVHPNQGVAGALELLGNPLAKNFREWHLRLAELALGHVTGGTRQTLLEMLGDMHHARGTLAEAIRYLRGALQSQRLPPEARTRLTRKLATAHAQAGNLGEAERCLSHLPDIPPGQDRQQMLEFARAKLAEAAIHFHRRRAALARRACEQAMSVGEQIGDGSLVAGALQRLGAVHLENGSVREAYPVLTESLRRFRLVEDATRGAQVLAALGRAEMLRQQWDKAIEYLQEALGALQSAGYLAEAARTHNDLGAVYQKLCDWQHAGSEYAEALARYEMLEDTRGKQAVLVNLSQVCASRGSLEEGVFHGREALRVGPDDRRVRCYAMLRIARAQYGLGDLPAAYDTALKALEAAETMDSEVCIEIGHRLIGEIETTRCNTAAAEAHLRCALEMNVQKGSPEREIVCLARLAEVAIITAALDKASSLADSACSKAASLPGSPVRAVSHCVRGKVALASDEPESALADLLEAESVFSKARVWDEQAEVALRLAQAYSRLGRLRFAAIFYRTALDTVEQVAHRLRSEENRALFLSDPRREELFAAVSAFRHDATSLARATSQRESPA